MRDSDSFGKFAGLIFSVGVALVIGGCAGRNDLRKEAVKAGIAEWRATPEGNVTFHWKEPAK